MRWFGRAPKHGPGGGPVQAAGGRRTGRPGCSRPARPPLSACPSAEAGITLRAGAGAAVEARGLLAGVPVDAGTGAGGAVAGVAQVGLARLAGAGGAVADELPAGGAGEPVAAHRADVVAASAVVSNDSTASWSRSSESFFIRAFRAEEDASARTSGRAPSDAVPRRKVPLRRQT